MENYSSIVKDILNNEEFNKTKYIEHHGVTRYDHLCRVSYYSYILAHKLRFKEKEVARASLLHDFFFSDELRTGKEKFLSTFIHPKWALKKAKKHFELNELEENIIESHMFPISNITPKYKESWIVTISDKLASGFDALTTAKAQVAIWIGLLANLIK